MTEGSADSRTGGNDTPEDQALADLRDVIERRRLDTEREARAVEAIRAALEPLGYDVVPRPHRMPSMRTTSRGPRIPCDAPGCTQTFASAHNQRIHARAKHRKPGRPRN